MYDPVPQGVSKIQEVKVESISIYLVKFEVLALTCHIFDTPFEIQGHTVSHLKALRYGIYEKRGLSCGSTPSICQGILKSGNLLHKWGSVKTQLSHTVHPTNKIG